LEIKTVWGVYFSPTGTTEKIVTGIAQMAAKLLGAEYKEFSFNLPAARKELLSLEADNYVVFGIPVYAGRVPNLLLPYIQEKVVGNGALATPIVLFGNRDYDDALIELRDVLQENGFYTISAGAFAGEHSFSTILGAGRPDDEDMRLAIWLAEQTSGKIQGMKERPGRMIAVKGNVPLRRYYMPRDHFGRPINILKAKPRTDRLKCIGCGLCASICTMGAIDPDNVCEIPGKCIKCCACVKKCPVQAKYFDDEGFLYHQHELEEVYERRAAVALFT